MGSQVVSIRKTAHLLFPLEKAGKAGISGEKHHKHRPWSRVDFRKALGPNSTLNAFRAWSSTQKHRKSRVRLLRVMVW